MNQPGACPTGLNGQLGCRASGLISGAVCLTDVGAIVLGPIRVGSPSRPRGVKLHAQSRQVALAYGGRSRPLAPIRIDEIPHGSRFRLTAERIAGHDGDIARAAAAYRAVI